MDRADHRLPGTARRGWLILNSPDERDGERDPDGPPSNALTGRVAGSSVQAGSISGGLHINAPHHAPLPAPAQLPPTGIFANRAEELRELSRIAATVAGAGQPRLLVLTGVGGVGKTSLALHWLHQEKASYEGQLFVDLRGFSGTGPLPPGETLERFLRALGTGAESIPADLDEQAALFRSATTGRRLIIMLDNAVSAAQVRPLLPNEGGSLIVVTTRLRLSGLVVNGARFLDVGPLGLDGALDLLENVIGADRIGAEDEYARELARLCGRLPLALCASAARLAARSRWTIARAVAELGDEARRLSALRTGEGEGDMSVNVVFNASYQALDHAHARAYRLLGIHPGPDFTVPAAAALLDVREERAVQLLDGLADVSLLLEEAQGPDERYRFHDLVRLHARDKAVEAEPEAEWSQALERLADRYLRTAVAADLTLLPGRWHLGDHYRAEARPEVFADRAEALDWLDREQDNLAAIAQERHTAGHHAVTWQICEAMWPLFLQRKHYQRWIRLYGLGVEAARACSDARAHARMLEGLGMAHLNTQDLDAARGHYRAALDLERRAGHPLGEAAALEGLGIAELAAGAAAEAIGLFGRARDVHTALDRPRGIALMTRHLGEALSAAGRHAEAVAHLTEALEIFTGLDEPYHRARTLTCLGQAHLRAGRPADAEAALRASLGAAREAGARHEEAGVLRELARVAADRGDPEAERDHLEKALAIYAVLKSPQEEAVREQLARSDPPP
ncbi:tetratricopeptide repeat protein [Actinomadura litoris]|uniref:tetratricopeptide repeat protein n=1 Tax=Actinomadura litoris TaxID=2678616 RepID=UPI0028ACFFB4|nr:tetratricopeptide repeat protein [Actinomadura litoris]